MAETADRIVIIGGGASGLMAAIQASQAGVAVTILEHKDRVGKKILMTGNGKCNLTNISDIHGKYYSSSEKMIEKPNKQSNEESMKKSSEKSNKKSLEKIYKALERFGATDTREFFQQLGLYTKEKNGGGIYPVSEQASAVLDVLRSACAYLGVTVKTGCEVVDITAGRQGGTVQYMQDNTKKRMAFDCVILAAGGNAAPATGSDGTGYHLAKKLGHSIITPLPALVQLRCEGDYFKSIAGVRAQAGLTLYVENKKAFYEEGELQLTDYGISGIPVFQFSRIAARAIHEKKKCRVQINFIPYMNEREMLDITNKKQQLGYKTIEEFLGGLVHKKVASLICRIQKIRPQERISEAGREKIAACLALLNNFTVIVKATNPFENAQVCSGGVPLWEVTENFQSQKTPVVYFAGELLDCDGICGGYNLQWAWTTGAIAGIAAAQQVLKQEAE